MSCRANAWALLALWVLCCLGFPLAHAEAPVDDEEDEEPEAPALIWEAKDSWELLVKPPDSNFYRVRVKVTALSAQSWSLGFYPGNGAPPNLRSQWHRVDVSKDTGFAARAWRDEDNSDIRVKRAGTCSFITGVPAGVPLEWINANELPVGTFQLGGRRTITISKYDLGGQYFLEMVLVDNDVEQLRIEQSWVRGEKWWRSYTRKVKGELELSAWIWDESDLQRPVKEKKRAPLWSQRPAIALDRRLKVRVKVNFSHPEVGQVLGTLEAATGLKLNLDPALADQPADLGELDLQSAVCWSVMNYIAARYPDGTHWEKTAEGYELTAGPAEEAPSSRRGFRTVAALTGLLLNGMLASAAGVAVWRRSRKNHETHETHEIEPELSV